MHTHNEIVVRAGRDRCFEAAADVERWPEILGHYRRVRFLRKDGFGRGRVEMAAYRHFGPLPYPVWWVSEMVADRRAGTVHYRHVDGITEGMRVEWRLAAMEAGDATSGDAPVAGADRSAAASPRPGPATRIVITHDWEGGPGWPVIGSFAAERVIGPHFVHVVAERTLEGIRQEVERG